jgi:hypothetical protein
MQGALTTLSVWPGFARRDKDNSLPGFARKDADGNAINAFSDDPANARDFKVTPESVKKDANLAAQMWLRHPAYRMTLTALQKGADANDDGLIDTEEFKTLLKDAGYKGGAAEALFARIDKDGDGVLTEAEIKMLSQGKTEMGGGHVG